MTDRKAQYRESKAKERKAKRDAGLVPLEVWVPRDKVEEVKDYIADLVTPPKLSSEWDQRAHLRRIRRIIEIQEIAAGIRKSEGA